jgi:hypothetical protein
MALTQNGLAAGWPKAGAKVKRVIITRSPFPVDPDLRATTVNKWQ